MGKSRGRDEVEWRKCRPVPKLSHGPPIAASNARYEHESDNDVFAVETDDQEPTLPVYLFYAGSDSPAKRGLIENSW